MKIIQLIGITLLTMMALFACNEKPQQTESDPFFDRLKEGNVTSDELDSLIDANGGETAYFLEVPKDRFEIVFPVNKKFVEKSTDIQIIDNEEVETYHYTANMQHEDDVNLGYQLSYNYVGDLKTDKEIRQLFNEQRDYWISATNSKIDMEKVIDLNGIPGRELAVTVDGSKAHMHGQMYYHKGVFYRLVVVTSEGNLFNSSISKFLKSFKIREKK